MTLRNATRDKRHTTPFVLLAAVLLGSSPASAQVNESCIVSVLNRASSVRADGTWRIDNIPSGFGRVKVRATCVESGSTKSGESDFVVIQPNAVTGISASIVLGSASPVPERLDVVGPQAPLGAPGASAQLQTSAVFADQTRADVTASATGTSYTVSNSAIASVSGEGLVTAIASGTVVVSAINNGVLGLARIQVVLSGDTDGDGILDDVELANGLDPNDPADALADPDHDGLTNREELLDYGTDIRKADTDSDGLADGREVALGTNPAVFDTDGDGLGDGLEVQCGSDPLDPGNYNLTCALQSVEVRPTTVVLVVNTVIGQASRQLQVTGHLTDGRALDLTAQARGTTYASSDLNIVNFGATDGEIFAGQDGTATVTVSNSGFSVPVPVTVRTFAPQALSSLAIPGARRVDVSGSFAFVAAGAAGLQIVDVGDRHNPVLAASLPLAGEALDVKVDASRAYVAAGSAGLQVVDVANPLAPVLLGSLDTPGEAQDLVVRSGRVFLADGSGGVRIIDASNAAVPTLLGAYTAGPGDAIGVDASSGRAVAAYRFSGIQVIDASDPGSPVGLGTLATEDAMDVVVDGTVAYVADYTGSLRTVDFSTPGAPQSLAQTPGDLGGYLLSVAKVRDFTFGADIFFVNGVPITDVSDPSNPTVRARLDFPGDATGTGIAADNLYVYLVADDGNLYIGQYLEITDDQGVSPTVALTAPPDGTQVRGGRSVAVRADAADDVAVASVIFTLDGAPVFTDFAAPYEFSLRAPLEVGLHALGAVAQDYGENQGVAATRSIDVLFNAPPSVSLTSPQNGDVVVENGRLTAEATASDDDSVAWVRFLLGGVEVARDSTAPFTAIFRIPPGVGLISLEGVAVDDVGQTASAQVTLNVIVDPQTTAVGRVVDGAGIGRENVTVLCNGVTGTSGAGGEFNIPSVPTTDDVVCSARAVGDHGEPVAAVSAAVPPVRGGVTQVGDLVLATQLLYLGSTDLSGSQPGRLHVLDEATSRFVPWSTPLRLFGQPVGVAGLAFDGTGRLFAVAAAAGEGEGGPDAPDLGGTSAGGATPFALRGRASSPARPPRPSAHAPVPSASASTPVTGPVLWRLDPETGDVLETVGAIHASDGSSPDTAHLTYNLRDGRFYAFDVFGEQRVYSVDVQTAAVTPIATLEFDAWGAGMAAGLDGMLYVLAPFGNGGGSALATPGPRSAITDMLLAAIDPTSGAVVSTSAVGGEQLFWIGGMARVLGGNKFLLTDAGSSTLFELDLSTLEVAAHASASGAGDTSLALDFRTVASAPVATTLDGTVVDGDGAPVDAAEVVTVGGSTSTVADGAFTLPDVLVLTPYARVFVQSGADTGFSASVTPVSGGSTDLGSVVVGAKACLQALLLRDCNGLPVSDPLDLFIDDGTGELIPVGPVVPDVDGRFCAVLRRDRRYVLRREDAVCCSQPTATTSGGACEVSLTLTDPGAGAQCLLGGCQDLGSVTMECDLFCGS